MGEKTNKEELTLKRQMEVLNKSIIPAMKKKNITRYRLSELSGVSQSTLSLWFRGLNGINFDNVLKICDALGINNLDVSK